jgi:quercetin dioxygenase-like cupin family protein
MAIARGIRVQPAELQLLNLKVTREGGALRLLEGARYGIHTSLYRAEILPGGGPVPHVHPYTEIFVIDEGQGRYQIGDDTIDAGAGDIVLVPPNMAHGFVNTAAGALRHTAIHEGAEHIISTALGPDPR